MVRLLHVTTALEIPDDLPEVLGLDNDQTRLVQDGGCKGKTRSPLPVDHAAFNTLKAVTGPVESLSMGVLQLKMTPSQLGVLQLKVG